MTKSEIGETLYDFELGVGGGLTQIRQGLLLLMTRDPDSFYSLSSLLAPFEEEVQYMRKKYKRMMEYKEVGGTCNEREDC